MSRWSTPKGTLWPSLSHIWGSGKQIDSISAISEGRSNEPLRCVNERSTRNNEQKGNGNRGNQTKCLLSRRVRREHKHTNRSGLAVGKQKTKMVKRNEIAPPSTKGTEECCETKAFEWWRGLATRPVGVFCTRGWRRVWWAQTRALRHHGDENSPSFESVQMRGSLKTRGAPNACKQSSLPKKIQSHGPRSTVIALRKKSWSKEKIKMRILRILWGSKNCKNCGNWG